MGKIYIGTSGYNYKSWRGDFYPEKLTQKEWLKFYSEKFNSVEINNSFYTTISQKTYKNWLEITPKNFGFVIKGHRYITQYKKLKNVDEEVGHFFDNILVLKDKLKCILWQFPKNFKFKDEYIDRLEVFLKLLPKNIFHAFEFREEGWFNTTVMNILEKNNSCLVVSQSSIFPEINMPSEKFTYLRFHGPEGLYSSGYSDGQLKKWAEKIKDYQKKKMTVFAFFNNDSGNYAVNNAEKLNNFI